MLKVNNLKYGPPNSPPLQENLSFSLSAGELLHIKGPNGSGKSLLSKAIIGDLQIASGSIENSFSGTRFLSQMQNRATHLPYSLQEVLFMNGKNLPWEKIGLLEKDQLKLSWNKASGGERQRTLLTRFFLQSGELLLIDEPFNHLDLESKEKTRGLIKELFSQDKKIAVILISHEDDPGEWIKNIAIKILDLGFSKVGCK